MTSPPTKSEARRLTGRRARRNLIEPQAYAHLACAQAEARPSGCLDENGDWQRIIKTQYLAVIVWSLPKIQPELKRLRRPAASARPLRTTLNRRPSRNTLPLTKHALQLLRQFDNLSAPNEKGKLNDPLPHLLH